MWFYLRRRNGPREMSFDLSVALCIKYFSEKVLIQTEQLIIIEKGCIPVTVPVRVAQRHISRKTVFVRLK